MCLAGGCHARLRVLLAEGGICRYILLDVLLSFVVECLDIVSSLVELQHLDTLAIAHHLGRLIKACLSLVKVPVDLARHHRHLETDHLFGSSAFTDTTSQLQLPFNDSIPANQTNT